MQCGGGPLRQTKHSYSSCRWECCLPYSRSLAISIRTRDSAWAPGRFSSRYNYRVKILKSIGYLVLIGILLYAAWYTYTWYRQHQVDVFIARDISPDQLDTPAKLIAVISRAPAMECGSVAAGFEGSRQEFMRMYDGAWRIDSTTALAGRALHVHTIVDKTGAYQWYDKTSDAFKIEPDEIFPQTQDFHLPFINKRQVCQPWWHPDKNYFKIPDLRFRSLQR